MTLFSWPLHWWAAHHTVIQTVTDILCLLFNTHCCVFQGGAAFWRNLYNNGTGNPLTLHAACPVLEGYKWGKLSSWFFVSYLPVLLTTSLRQKATRLIGERPNLYSENIIQLIGHPQWQATLTYKPRLVGEHREGNAVFHSQATLTCHLENIFNI